MTTPSFCKAKKVILPRLISSMVVLAFLLAGCSPTEPPNQQTTFVPVVTTAAPTPVPSETPPPSATPSPTSTNTPLPLPTDTPEPTPTFTVTPLPESIIDSKGVPMVLVPAGSFVMGSDHDQAEAKPAHTVMLDDYYIDQFEATNRQYLACAEAGVCTTGGGQRIRQDIWADHPVMDVTWYEAEKYCEWRGGRLPTEAQWEKAARGTDERKFPWGNDPVTCELARYGDCGWFTVPVGKHPKGVSPYGVHDMAGNAWEWTYDWYEADYYSHSPVVNPTGPERETGWKVTRGGAWFYAAGLMTAIWRNHAPPTAAYSYLGFRCVVLPIR